MASPYFELLHPIIAHAASDSRARLEMSLDYDQLHTLCPSPFQKMWLGKPFGELQAAVHDLLLREDLKKRAGIMYPKENTVTLKDGTTRNILELPMLGLAVDDFSVETFAVMPDENVAVPIGRIVTQRPNGNHYGNTSSNLGYDLSAKISRVAMVSFCHSATFNEFND